jgi:hypothetical protein
MMDSSYACSIFDYNPHQHNNNIAYHHHIIITISYIRVSTHNYFWSARGLEPPAMIFTIAKMNAKKLQIKAVSARMEPLP